MTNNLPQPPQTWAISGVTGRFAACRIASTFKVRRGEIGAPQLGQSWAGSGAGDAVDSGD